jgi:hypothetical protein
MTRRPLTEEELDESLHAILPAPALPPALAARVHDHARAVFERAGAPRRVAVVATATAVVSAVALYLAWAVQFLNALGRG